MSGSDVLLIIKFHVSCVSVCIQWVLCVFKQLDKSKKNNALEGSYWQAESWHPSPPQKWCSTSQKYEYAAGYHHAQSPAVFCHSAYNMCIHNSGPLVWVQWMEVSFQTEPNWALWTKVKPPDAHKGALIPVVPLEREPGFSKLGKVLQLFDFALMIFVGGNLLWEQQLD